MRLRFALIIAGTVLATADVNAQPQPRCGQVATIVDSAIPLHNALAGGHLATHIMGVVPPLGMTQAGRTLFTDEAVYDGVWGEFLHEPNVDCPAHPVLNDQVVHEMAAMMISQQCLGADVAGMCNNPVPVHTAFVRFIFRAVNLNHNVSWILLTAYPHQ